MKVQQLGSPLNLFPPANLSHFLTVLIQIIPTVDMAAVSLTQADTFVEFLPIAPDPSVTFSQAMAC